MKCVFEKGRTRHGLLLFQRHWILVFLNILQLGVDHVFFLGVALASISDRHGVLLSLTLVCVRHPVAAAHRRIEVGAHVGYLLAQSRVVFAVVRRRFKISNNERSPILQTKDFRGKKSNKIKEGKLHAY